MKKIFQYFVISNFIIVIMLYANHRDLNGDNMDCPNSPNCVSSLASTPSHFIAPLIFKDRPELAMQRLKKVLMTEKRVTIITERSDYLYGEIRSFVFRFVDDIEFTLSIENKIFQVRSSSRIGYSDFGVNRRRIERIRKKFENQD